MRHPILGLVIAVVLGACATDEPDPTAGATATPPASSTPSPTPDAPAPTETPTPEPTPLVAVPAAGRPYDAATILAAMRDSRRPGGVPDQLETQETAGSIAERIWTIGGEPWDTIGVGASCGTDSCLVEIGGTPAGAAGEDLYVFDVHPGDGRITLVDATLQGLEPATVEALDRVARDASPVDLDGFALASARWLPPPDDGQFILAYRSGGEEGSPRVDLLVDLEAGSVTSMPQALLSQRGSG